MKIRLGQQQQARLASMSRIQDAIKEIETATAKSPPCLTNDCSEDTDALLKLLKPIQRLLGAPRFRELKQEVLDKRISSIDARVPFQSFRLASEQLNP